MRKISDFIKKKKTWEKGVLYQEYMIVSKLQTDIFINDYEPFKRIDQGTIRKIEIQLVSGTFFFKFIMQGMDWERDEISSFNIINQFYLQNKNKRTALYFVKLIR